MLITENGSADRVEGDLIWLTLYPAVFYDGPFLVLFLL